MKYNNEDMDDLFRRAAEKYPLRTDSADWDRLAGDLDGDPAPPRDEEDKRRRRGVVWWFLLIPLTAIGYLTWHGNARYATDKVVTAAPTAAGKAGTKAGGKAAGAATGTAAGTASGTPEVARTGGTNSTGPVNGAMTVQDSARNGVAMIAESQNEKVRKMRTSRASGSVAGTGGNSSAVDNQYSKTIDGLDQPATGGQKVRKMRTFQERPMAGENPNVNRGAIGSPSTSADINRPEFAWLDLSRAPIGGRNRIYVDVSASMAPALGLAATGGNSDRSQEKRQRNSHFYAGISAAPDFSTVHFQRMKGIGTTFGVLLGYSFNDRWSVESGVYLDRKRYYTQGEYFHTEKVSLPPYYKLLNVDGTCYMWEIPVNVRYNFNKGPKVTWFATTGLSTYLMSHENYTYQYEYNWLTENSNWNIHKPSQYWFSIVNLSAGFEKRVGKIGSLRLEPYMRIPLSGIGTGSLPILSGGVNIGLTHPLW